MIAIVTSSARFYHKAAEELKNRGLAFITLTVDEAIPPGVKVVLTTPEEEALIDFPRVAASDDFSLAIEEADLIMKGFKEKNRIIIGIDPGKKPGVAVVADNRATDSFVAQSPRDIKNIINRILSLHQPREVVVRVGSGGGIYGMQILKHLGKIQGITVEIVDERSTSKNSEVSFHPHRDAGAALNIALKKGMPLESPVQASIKPGELKNIQKESRVVSRDLTISKALARKVAKGELSLEEAVMKQRKRRKERGA